MGKRSCPSKAGAEKVYSGIVGGTKYSSGGGGANHLCLPEKREYSDKLAYTPGVQGYAYIWGAQYWGVIGASNRYSIPCAVCYVPARPTVLMIPGQARCPPSWTREYFGYLMSEYAAEKSRHRSMYECVDRDTQSLSQSPEFGSVFHLVEANCNTGLSCPAGTAEKEVNCVVCTK